MQLRYRRYSLVFLTPHIGEIFRLRVRLMGGCVALVEANKTAVFSPLPHLGSVFVNSVWYMPRLLLTLKVCSANYAKILPHFETGELGKSNNPQDWAADRVLLEESRIPLLFMTTLSEIRNINGKETLCKIFSYSY